MIKLIRNALLVLLLSLSVIACSTTEEAEDDDILSDVEQEAGTTDDEQVASNDEDEEGFDDEVEEEDEAGEEEEITDEDLGEEPEEEVAEEEEQGDDFADEEAEEEQAEEDPLQEDLEDGESEEQQQFADEESQDDSGMDEANAQAVVIQNIKYVKNREGGAVEVVTNGDATFRTRVNSETNQFVIEVANATLPDRLKRPFIMKEFDGAFGAINAYQEGGSKTARIVVQMKKAMDPVAQKEGNTIVVVPGDSMSVATNNAAPEEGEQQVDGFGGDAAAGGDDMGDDENWNAYEKDFLSGNNKILSARTLDDFLTGDNRFFGKRLSIEIDNRDVTEVIKFIADFSGANIVMSEDVEGKISIKLRQVPWDQALVTVMRAHNLGYIREGNVLRISKLKTLQEEATAANAIVAAQKGLAPLKVKVIPVSFAQVKELEKQVEKFLTKARGQVVSDDRTSSLIVTDTIDVLDRISRLVKELDIPPAQVLIEGKIVEATESFVKRTGVNWGFSGAPTNIGTGYNGSTLNLTTGLNIQPVSADIASGSTTSLNLSVGTLDFLGSLTATLALAEQDQLVKVVSAPRILAMNKQKATISQKGQVVSILTSVLPNSDVPVRTVERQDVNLKLDVTPQITSNGSVILDVDVLREFPGPELEGGQREINSRNAKTKVLVKNGQTAVIGGIYQSDTRKTETGTPGLKELPFFGWLFKSKVKENQKNELLLFLTPRILNAKDLKVKDLSS